jgi:hypothetical protein
MSLYLHLRCGDCELLLHVDSVEEVGFVGDDPVDGNDHEQGSGMRRWRDGLLPFFRLGTVLGHGGGGRQQVVVNDEGQRCLVEVDVVLDLLPVDDHEWRSFPAVTPQARDFFDAALPQDDGRCLLRLRRPLAWLQGAA